MTIQEQIIETARGIHIPGLQPISNPFVEVLHIESFTDFLVANLYVGGFYYALYLVGGGTISTIQLYSNTQILFPRRLRELPPPRNKSKWV
jgi:hypothetical protein